MWKLQDTLVLGSYCGLGMFTIKALIRGGCACSKWCIEIGMMTFRSWSSPFYLVGPGIDHRSSGLAESTFAHLAISLAPCYLQKVPKC